MTFDQLNYFIAVTEFETFFDAAESLHMTQSALSKQIIKLEKELGITLLDRSRRSASLTEAGAIFYQDALKLTGQYHQVLSRLQLYKDALQKEVHVGTLPILNQYHLLPLFKKFTEQNPDIHIHLDEVEEQELQKGLASEHYDIVITRANMITSGQYMIYPLAEDELMAVLPADHSLSGTQSLKLSDLSGESFLLMNPYTSIYHLCMDCFKSCNITPHIIRTARVESILSAVSIGEGISLLAKSNFQVFHHENVVAVPLNPPVPLPVIIAAKKDCVYNKSVTRLIHCLTS